MYRGVCVYIYILSITGLSKGSFTGKMLFKPYVAMQTYAPNPDSLNLLARGRSVQSSTRRKSEQLCFKGRILSKSSSIYPP